MRKLLLFVFLIATLSGNAQVVNISDTNQLRSYINTVIVNNNIRAITAQNFNNALNGFLNTITNDSITIAQGASKDTLWFWKRRSKAFYVLLRVGTLSAITQYSSLTDVSLTTLSDGQLARWNGATSKWNNFTLDKSFIGLGAVENTALSTWAGSANINRVGTIANGIWNGSPIADQYISSASNWNAKQNAIPLGTGSQYFKGDLTLGNFSAATVGLGNVQNVDQTNASNLSSGSIPAGRYGNATIPISAIGATGGASTDYLRKDGTWATPPGSGGVSAYASLTDVVLTSLANGQLVKWNSTTSKWNNFAPGSSDVIAWLGYTPINPTGTTSQYWRGNGTLATFPTDLSSFGNSPGYLSGTVGADHGGSGLASYTAYSLLAAGTTSTGNYQQIAPGTAGQVLTSNGPGALATMQNPASSSALGTLSDVALTSISNAQLIKWNNSTSKWNNFTPSLSDVTTWLGYTPVNPNGTTSQYFKGDGTKATFPSAVSFFINDANYLTSITGSQITGALGYSPVNPNGTTSQYIRGDGSKATTDTNMIANFYTKVRSLFSSAGPLRLLNGQLSADTVSSVSTNLVSYAWLNNNLDTFTYYHNAPIWLTYTNGSKTIFDKGLRNTGTVLFTTLPDSSIVANVDTTNKIATRYDLTRLNAANLSSGAIPAARFGPATIPLAAINASGAPGSTTYLRGDGTWAAGGFNANLNVFSTPTGDSIQISTGLSAFLPLTTNTNAGAFSPLYKLRTDSIQEFANTRQGDSLMWWNGKDTFWVKGVTVRNDGNMIWTSRSTQKEVIWGGAVDTSSGLTKIPTRGEITRNYLAIPAGSNQGYVPLFNTNGSLAASPIQYDGTQLNASKPFNFPASSGSDITSVVGSGKLLGISYLGSTTSPYFTPLQALVSAPALYTVIENTSTSSAGNQASSGMQIWTAYAGGDAYTSYSNRTSSNAFLVGLTQRYGAINTFSIARGANNSFIAATQLLSLDSVGNLKLPRYGGAGSQMLAVDNNGNVFAQSIPSGTLTNPMTAVGDMIIGGASGLVQRLTGGANGSFLKMVSGAPAWAAVSKADVGLSAVENTAISTWSGSSSIGTVGTIGSGTWNGTKIGLLYGGTNTDLSATGGAGRVLKQLTAGGSVSVAQLAESELVFTDITTNNATTSLHGFLPKLSGGSTTFLNGVGGWTTPTKGDVGLSAVENTALSTWAGSANIATVGTIGSGIWHGTKIGLLYGGTNADLSATGGAGKVLKQLTTGGAVSVAQLAESELAFTDIATNNATTSVHGFLPKLPGVSSSYLDGTGNYSNPITAANIAAASYTPTVTNLNNGNTISVVAASYYRTNSQVFVNGIVQLKYSAANTVTNFTVSLPVASSLSAGIGAIYGTATILDGDNSYLAGFCSPNSGATAAQVNFKSGSIANNTFLSYARFNFSYTVQ